MKILVVVDMQNDFIDGALGTKEAVSIVPRVVEKIRQFDGRVLYTRDTHEGNYLETQEEKKSAGSTLHPGNERLGTGLADRSDPDRKGRGRAC